MSEVERTRTPVELGELRALLAEAFAGEGLELSRNAASMLAALVWLETADGQSLWNHNLGNLTYGESDRGDWWPAPWLDAYEIEQLPDGERKERYRRLWQLARQGLAPTRFRAFDSAEQGAQAFADLLARPRFAPLMKAADRGDVAGFSREIDRSGYTPGIDAPAHAASMRAKLRIVSPAFDDLPDSARSAGGWGLFLGAVALAALVDVFALRRRRAAHG